MTSYHILSKYFDILCENNDVLRWKRKTLIIVYLNSILNIFYREIQTDWAIGNVYVNPLQNANNNIYQGDKLV